MEVNANPISLNQSVAQRLDRASDERQARQASPERQTDSNRVERPFDAQALAQRGQELEERRFQRVNENENLDRATQNALQSYHQNQSASLVPDAGELAGIDLFV